MADGQAGLRSRRAKIAFRIGFVAVLAILLSLGTWQVQRLQWKERLIAERDARRQTPPVSIAALNNIRSATHAPGDTIIPPESVEFLPVQDIGTFDNAHEMFFLATENGQPGFHIYVPFHLESGRIIIVNRGFVPEARRDPATRKSGLIEGRTTLTGLAREMLFEKPGSLLPENDLKANLFFWKDLYAMADKAGISRAELIHFFVDVGPNADPNLLPKGGVTIFDLPNNHLQYALTWYGLALALVGVAIAGMIRASQRSER